MQGNDRIVGVCSIPVDNVCLQAPEDLPGVHYGCDDGGDAVLRSCQYMS